jgi:hypothetical protein
MLVPIGAWLVEFAPTDVVMNMVEIMALTRGKALLWE